jgi:hypothetical protein
MRVRILKPFYFAKRGVSYRAGEVIDVSCEDAEVWLKSGMAMQDKSIDGATETKAEPAKAVKRTAKKR